MYQYFKEILCPQNETEHIDDNLLADIRQNHDPAGLNCIITTGVLLIYMQINFRDQMVVQNFFKCTSEFTVPY